VVELVDARDSKSRAARRAGSIPAPGTRLISFRLGFSPQTFVLFREPARLALICTAGNWCSESIACPAIEYPATCVDLKFSASFVLRQVSHAQELPMRFFQLARSRVRCAVGSTAIAALSLLGLQTGGVAQAATPEPATASATMDALSKANAAVVGLRVSVSEGARSAETLGKERSGSGVVIGPDGLILTIGYLMLEAQNIQIITADNKTLPAQAVAYDQATGFGLIKPLLPLRGVHPVVLGSLSDIASGESLMAATGAQADGEEADVSMTQMVSKRAFSGYWEYHIDAAVFTSPPIGHHSGAALFNQRGELIGIGSLYVTNAIGPDRRLPGNMFVPVDLLKPILAEMQTTGGSKTSRRPWIGLTSSEQAGRVQIVRVSKDGPAEAAGLEAGDFVLAVDGAKVTSLETFYKQLWAHEQPDAEITLTVLQGADVKTITLKAVDRMSTMRKPAGI
jgi:serine protease Do